MKTPTRIAAMLLFASAAFTHTYTFAADGLRIRQYTASSSWGSSSTSDDGNGHTQASDTTLQWALAHNWQGTSTYNSAYNYSMTDSDYEGNGPCYQIHTNGNVTIWSGPNVTGTNVYQAYDENCYGSYPSAPTTNDNVAEMQWPDPFIKVHLVSASVTNGPSMNEETGYFETYITNPNVQDHETYVDLVTTGPTNSGGNTLWLITITAYDRHSQSQVAASNLTILGVTPDAYGRVLKLVANNTTNDATPVFTGLPSQYNIQFEMTASPMRLQIHGAGGDITGQTVTNWWANGSGVPWFLPAKASSPPLATPW